MARDRIEGGNTTPLYTLANAWDVLLRRGWLAGRSPEAREMLRGIARVTVVDAGKYLYRVGDQPNGIFGLVSGAFDLTLPRMDGEEFTVHRADPGFWVGDLALFARQRRLVSVRAAAHCHVVHLPQARIGQLIATNPELTADFYELSHENMATTLNLLSNLAISGAENRVALRLLMQHEKLEPDGDWIAISQESLAELVALSLQSVRRAVTQLEKSGLIETGYGKIRVCDADRLASLCGYTVPARRVG